MAGVLYGLGGDAEGVSGGNLQVTDEGYADAEVPANVIFVGLEVLDSVFAEAESEVWAGEDRGEEHMADYGHGDVVAEVEGHGEVAVVDAGLVGALGGHLGCAVFVECGDVGADIDDGHGELGHYAAGKAAAVVGREVATEVGGGDGVEVHAGNDAEPERARNCGERGGAEHYSGGREAGDDFFHTFGYLRGVVYFCGIFSLWPMLSLSPLKPLASLICLTVTLYLRDIA